MPSPRSRLIIWPRETGSAVPSRVSPLTIHTQAVSGAYSRYSARFLAIRQSPQKEGGEILCDPGWCVHKSNVQNKRDNNTTAFYQHAHFILPVGVGKERRTLIGL